jgi:hypothetical protein
MPLSFSPQTLDSPPSTSLSPINIIDSLHISISSPISNPHSSLNIPFNNQRLFPSLTTSTPIPSSPITSVLPHSRIQSIFESVTFFIESCECMGDVVEVVYAGFRVDGGVG